MIFIIFCLENSFRKTHVQCENTEKQKQERKHRNQKSKRNTTRKRGDLQENKIIK